MPEGQCRLRTFPSSKKILLDSSTLDISGFPGTSVGKESACNVEDPGLIPGSGRFPGGGYGNPHQCSCLENPHGQRCLAGYSLWGHKESDMTEQLNTVEQHRREKGEESLFKERIAENFTHLGKETTVQVHES